MQAMLLLETGEIGTEFFRRSPHVTSLCDDPSRLSSEHFFGRLMDEGDGETNNKCVPCAETELNHDSSSIMHTTISRAHAYTLNRYHSHV
jgi:hypothetical protein